MVPKRTLNSIKLFRFLSLFLDKIRKKVVYFCVHFYEIKRKIFLKLILKILQQKNEAKNLFFFFSYFLRKHKFPKVSEIINKYKLS